MGATVKITDSALSTFLPSELLSEEVVFLVGEKRQRAKRPLIPVEINGQSTIGFLDSGSTISAINLQMSKLFPPENSDDCNKQCRSVSGNFTVLNTVNAGVKIGDLNTEHKFYVIPTLPTAVLLGNDFLFKNKIDLFPSRNTCKIENKLLPFATSEKAITNPHSFAIEDVRNILSNFEIDFNVPNEYKNLLIEYNDLFNKKPGVAQVEPMRIITGEAKPIRQVFRPCNPAKIAIIQKHVAELQAMGCIEPSRSPWAVNLVMVEKPNGEKRPCGDYRQLNNVTQTDAFPMPSVSDIFRQIATAKVFSVCDLAKGFHQIPVHPDDRCKTAFYDHSINGLSQYKVMPFGLKNAPAEFQRVMNLILSDMRQFVMVYIDDVVIFSENISEHLVHMRLVFDKLRKSGLRINPEKIQLLKTEIKLLGHYLGEYGIKPDPEKIEGIKNFPLPASKKGLQRFLGSVNYYRDYLPKIASTTQPLYAITGKNAKFDWTPSNLEAFQKTKEALVNLVLDRPDLSGTFLIQADASLSGLGAVIMQTTDEKQKRGIPVSFISRILHGAERNYSTTELECLAVVWAIEKFRPFIEYTRFIIETDHSALKWLMQLKDPKGRLARWIMKLQGYDFEIRHRPGATNKVADFLSRQSQDDSRDIFAVCDENENHFITKDFDFFSAVSRAEIIEKQQLDEKLKFVKLYLSGGKLPETLAPKEKAKIICLAEDAFVLDDGLLVKYTNPFNYGSFEDEYNHERIILPVVLRDKIFKFYHDSPLAGHGGTDRTYDKVQRHFYWQFMYRDIGNYCHSCEICQRCNTNTTKPKGKMLATAHRLPWEKISVDLMGPYPKSKKGNEYLLTVTDPCSGWVEAFPMRGTAINAINCVDRMLSVFCRWGFPKVIISDNGPQFASKIWVECMRKLDITASFITPYHPQANPVERKNKDIKSFLRKYVDKFTHKNWDESIDAMLFALRTTKNQSSGLTAAKILLGRELTAPGELIFEAENDPVDSSFNATNYADKIAHRIQCGIKFCLENRKISGQVQKIQFDKHRSDFEFKEGDLVWLQSHPLSNKAKGVAASLAAKREGPYKIHRKMNPRNYMLATPDNNQVVTFAHIVQLSPYIERKDQTTVAPAGNASGTAAIAVSEKPRLGRGKPRGRPPATSKK